MNTTSRYLARLIGPVALAMGAYIVLNGAAFRIMVGQFLASYALIFLAGLITLTAGLAIVLVHNVWTRDWRVIITVFGWLAVIGGCVAHHLPAVRRLGRRRHLRAGRSASRHRRRRRHSRRRAELFRISQIILAQLSANGANP